MPITINGTGPIDGITSLNTTVSSTELGYLDGVTSAVQSQINTAGGLVKITDATFSAQSSVSVNNCFTSTYENYRIIFSSTSSASMRLRLRVSGSDDTTSNYDNAGRYEGTASTAIYDSAATSWRLQDVAATTQNHFVMNVVKPQIAEPTIFFSQTIGSSPGTNFYTYMMNGQHRSSTAFDGFTVILGGAGNFTGTLRVYGFRN